MWPELKNVAASQSTRLPVLLLPPFLGLPVPPRSSSVFMERELTLDGAIVSAVFHDSMDMGVVGTTAGTLWYVSWAEGTSTRLISGHRSKVRLLGHWLSVKDVPGGFHPGQGQGWEPHMHSSLSVLSPCPQLSF